MSVTMNDTVPFYRSGIVRKNKLIASLCLFAVLVFVVSKIEDRRALFNADQSSMEVPTDQNRVGIPFDIFRLEKDDRTVPLWTIGLRLPDKYFSKENLIRIFRFYSCKYPDEKGDLIINVLRDSTFRVLNDEKPVEPSRSRWVDARFDRLHIRSERGGAYNESFDYIPDLETPNKNDVVVLRGTHPFAKRIPIESWKTSAGALSIQMNAYKLEYVEPKEFYYSFETPRGIIFSVRLDNKVNVGGEQAQFINDKICYLFLAGKYAVTTDGGDSWSVWDAERDYGNCLCDNCYCIQDVKLLPDATGIMKVKLVSEDKVVELQTKDFGKHWSLNE